MIKSSTLNIDLVSSQGVRCRKKRKPFVACQDTQGRQALHVHPILSLVLKAEKECRQTHAFPWDHINNPGKEEENSKSPGFPWRGKWVTRGCGYGWGTPRMPRPQLLNPESRECYPLKIKCENTATIIKTTWDHKCVTRSSPEYLILVCSLDVMRKILMNCHKRL